MFRDHGPRENAAGVAHHIFKQRIFLDRQLNALSSACDFSGRRVQDEVLDLEQACGFSAAPPQQGPHSRQQFFDRKGFRQVVIGARVQPLDSLIDLRPGREDQHRCLDFLLPDPLQDLQPRQPWQHQIQDDEVVAPAQGQIEPLGPLGAEVHRVALFLQRPSDEGADLRFVLNDQNTHRAVIGATSAGIG